MHEKCLVCNSSRLKEMKKYQHAYLVKCNNCGFVFSQRNPTEDELIKHYTNYPREHHISPLTINKYHQILASFERYRKTNNLLDVGCGNGHFLVEAKNMGWNVYGTEYTDDAVYVCNKKEICIKKGKLVSNSFKKNFFDIITSFEVIEHINYPVQEIKVFYRFLRPKGIVYITTPNFNSISRFILNHNWNIIEYPEHLSYYTKNTLNKLMKKNSFENIAFKSSGISVNRFRNNASHLKKKNISTDFTDEKLRSKIEKSGVLKTIKVIINFLLTTLSIGDTLKVIYIKR